MPETAIQLLTDLVEGAGNPHVDSRVSWVDIQVDKPLWEQAKEWLATRRSRDDFPEAVLRGETRADAWAQQFTQLFPGAPDEEIMLGWFANAIMAGYSWGHEVASEGE